MTWATHFVARQGIEPQTIRLQGECFNHCDIDLAATDNRTPRHNFAGIVIVKPVLKVLERTLIKEKFLAGSGFSYRKDLH